MVVPPDERTVRRDVEDLLNSDSGLKANFLVIAGADIGRKFSLHKAETLIGRGDTCDISVNDEDVSRNHAKVTISPAGIFLEDLGSTNGTLVNGKAITRHDLTDGDRIQIGNMTVLKFNFFNELEESYNEQLYMAANRDFLTDCYNKKYFLDRLRMEMSHARRHDSPLSLIMFDIDHFKAINDGHGHVAGDIILKQLTSHISAAKRQEDLMARYGGEEFFILLRETSKKIAVQIAEKIRQQVENLQFEIEDQRLRITISLGVETFLGNNFDSADGLLRAIDAQLYRAKNDGRNRVKYELDPAQSETSTPTPS